MNPNAESPETGSDITPAVPVATTILHMGADIAVAVSFSDGTASAGGHMTQALANDLTATVLSHLVEQDGEHQPAPESDHRAEQAEIVPKVTTVEIPLAIDLDDFIQWYADRAGPSDEPVDVPHPKDHPQLAAEYFQHLLSR